MDIERRPIFDAVLVHCYLSSQVGEGENTRIKPNIRSHIQDRAAARFYNHGRGVGKIVLTAEPSATAMKEELVRKYSVPSDNIIINTSLIKDGEEREVTTTDQEIDVFLDLARENGWTKLADIAARVHNTRILPGIGATIPMIYKRKGRKVETQAAEDIVLKNHDVRIRGLIRKLVGLFSVSEFLFRSYELVKKLKLIRNPDYEALSGASSTRLKEFIMKYVPIDPGVGKPILPSLKK